MPTNVHGKVRGRFWVSSLTVLLPNFCDRGPHSKAGLAEQGAHSLVLILGFMHSASQYCIALMWVLSTWTKVHV